MSNRDLITVAEVLAYDPSRSNLVARNRAYFTGWTHTNVDISGSAMFAPDNLWLADEVLETGANGPHSIEQLVVSDCTQPHILSAFIKKSTVRNAQLTILGADLANFVTAVFNLTTGGIILTSVGGTGTGNTAGVVPYSNDWFRCWVAGTPQTAAGAAATVRIQLYNGASSYLGNAALGSGLGLDHVLLERGTTVLGAPIDTGLLGGSGPGERRLFFASRAFATTGTDGYPHTEFDPRIEQPPSFIRRAFGDARVTSGGQASGGELELANRDRGLTELLDLGLDGREIILRVGQDGAAYPSGFTTWLTGTVDQPFVGVDKASLLLRDRMTVLDLPLQSQMFAGTNSGTPLSGAEGTADDLQGKPKPLAFGKCDQVPGVLVNTAKLTYMFHNGTIDAVSGVFDSGVALTFGSNRANLAALEAATISASHYDTCLSLGLIRLGSTPVGVVTANIRGDTNGGYVDRPGAIVRRLLTQYCGVSTGFIDSTTFNALDVAAPYSSGIWFGAEVTRRSAVEMLQASIGAWFLPSRVGIWTAGRLEVPAGTAAMTLDNDKIIDVERVPTSDPGGGVPVGECRLRYARNWTPFGEANLAASVTGALRSSLLQEWRTTPTAENLTTKAAHLLFTKLERDTYLVNSVDAVAERDRLMALHSVRRDYVKLRTGLTEEVAALDLGSVVDVVTDVLGYSSARKMIVMGIGLEGNFVDLELWG